MSPTTTYYKDSQLDKIRTARSLLRYYLKEWVAGRKPSRVIVDASYVDNLEA